MLIGVAILGAPWYMGGQVLDAIEAGVAELDATPGYRAQLTATRRGWFSSEVRWTLEAGFGAPPGVDRDSLPVVVHVQHGPWLFDEFGWFGPARLVATPDVDGRPDWQQALSAAGIDHWLQVDARLQPDGDARINVHMPAHAGDGYRFDGANAAFDWNDSTRRLAGHFSVPGVRVDDGQMRVQMGDLAGHVDVYHWNDQLYVGNANVTVAALDADSGDHRLRLADIDIDTDTRVDDDETTMTAGLRYAIGNLEIDDTQVSELVFDIAYRRFDVGFVAGWLQRVDGLPSGGKPDDAATRAALVDLLDSAGPRLLASSPAIEINQLSFDWQGETTTLSAIASIDGDNLPAAIAWQDPLFWLTRLDVEAFAIAPEAVARQVVARVLQNAAAEQQISPQARQALLAQVPQVLATLTRQGILTASSDGYRTRFQMRAGRMKLNDRPIPMPDLSELQPHIAAAW